MLGTILIENQKTSNWKAYLPSLNHVQRYMTQFVLCLEEKQVNIVAIDFGKQEYKCKTSNRMQD